MDQANNPAGRLLNFLSTCLHIDVGERNRKAWADALGTSEDDMPEVLRRMGCLFETTRQVEDKVRAIEGVNHDLHLRWIPKVHLLFMNMNFNAKWAHSSQHIDAFVIQGLEFCNDLLSRECPEPPLDEQQLKKVYVDVQAIFDDVVNSSIAAELKRFMIKHLHAIQQGIDDYWILGASNLRTAFEAAAGAAYFEYGVAKEMRNTEIGTKFWNFVGRVAIILTLYTGPPRIARDVSALIEPHLEQESEPSANSNDNVQSDADELDEPLAAQS